MYDQNSIKRWYQKAPTINDFRNYGEKYVWFLIFLYILKLSIVSENYEGDRGWYKNCLFILWLQYFISSVPNIYLPTINYAPICSHVSQQNPTPF